MAFKTFVAGATLTAAEVNDYLMKQAVIVATSGTRPASPVEGMTIYETDTDKLLTYDGATWNLPKNVAGGHLAAPAVVTASQTGISGDTDLTGLSRAVTVGANRRIKVIGSGLVSGTVAGDTVVGYIKEGATVLGRWCHDTIAAAGASRSFERGVELEAPTAGAHTYKLSLQRLTGTGTVGLEAAATYPASIAVVDLGGV